MPVISDTGGGGSTSNFCAPTPSDMEGQINNILTRLTNLEKAVSELQGADVTATQLSDLSQQVGWVYDVTYLGTAGWTQTEAGTLIPPAGLALSTLGIILPGLGNNPATLVATDSDGNPTFTVTNTGGTSGGGGGGAAVASFSSYSVSNTFVDAFVQTLEIDTVTIDTIGVSLSGNHISSFPTGWYLVTGNIIVSIGSVVTGLTMYCNLQNTAFTINAVIGGFNFTSGSYGAFENNPSVSIMGVTYITSGDSVYLDMAFDSQPLNPDATVYVDNLSFVQLSATAAPP